LIWLGYFSCVSILIPFFLGLARYADLTKLHKVFWIFIVFSCCFEFISDTYYFLHLNNMFLFKIFLVCDLLFISWFYFKAKSITLWLKVSTILVICFSFLSFFPTLNLKLRSAFYITIFLFFIAQSAFILFSIFKNVEQNPFKDYLFWISFGRLFYFLIISIVFICSALFTKIFENELYQLIFHSSNSIGNIIGNILFGISFLCKKT